MNTTENDIKDAALNVARLVGPDADIYERDDIAHSLIHLIRLVLAADKATQGAETDGPMRCLGCGEPADVGTHGLNQGYGGCV